MPPAAAAVPVPAGWADEQALGLVVSWPTALAALRPLGDVTAGQTVLIEGAAGGVGGYAIQIAKLLGATVIGAASTPARREAALAQGADHVVDYTREGWESDVRELTGGQGADLVLQLGGDDTIRQAVASLAPFGRVVVLGMPGQRPLTLDAARSESFFHVQAYNQSLISFNVGTYFELRPEAAVQALTTLIGYVATGRVKAPVGTVLPLERAADAHRLLENREATGKIVLKPWSR